MLEPCGEEFCVGLHGQQKWVCNCSSSRLPTQVAFRNSVWGVHFISVQHRCAKQVGMSDFPPPPPPPSQSGIPNASIASSGIGGSFRSTQGVGKALFILMILIAGGYALLLVAAVNRYSFISDVKDGTQRFDVTRAENADSFVSTAAGFTVMLSIAVFVLLIIFLYRIVSNTRNQGGRLRHSNGMAIGGFFIPIANIFIPYRLFTDVSRHLQSQSLETQRVLVVLNWWWWSYFAGIIFLQLSSSITGDDFDSLMTSDGYVVIGALVLAVSGVLGAITIRRLSAAASSVYV
jgi:heme/copper-type cytochrome/quinol oxidase subunit 2